MPLVVLVGGWPGSGKTSLARALADELEPAYLAKDEVKEAPMDILGTPATVEESRRLGRAAATAVLRAARGCPGAVIDSTWFRYAVPLARALPGPVVEVRCVVDRTVAEQRYRARTRDARHLDAPPRRRGAVGRPRRPSRPRAARRGRQGGPVDVAEVAGRVLSRVDGAFMDRPRGGYGPGMTTTPQEPSPDPEVVPSGDPEPIETPEPGEEPRPEPRP